jgi:hypothetical protein
MPRAILLKTKGSPEDPYDIAFREKTPFVPVFVPVLIHKRVNEFELRAILQNDPSNRYMALIITSQRAVEALDDAMSCLTGLYRTIFTDIRRTIMSIERNDGVYCWTCNCSCSY